jgi:hypothetical protein
MPRPDLCKWFSDPEACDAAAAKQMEIIKWTIARKSSVLSKIRAIVIQSSVWKKFFLDDPFFTDPSDTMTGASPTGIVGDYPHDASQSSEMRVRRAP